MNKKILHLSHTDISVDSRILKEMTALDSVEGYELMGIGISNIKNVSGKKKKFKFNIKSLRSWGAVLVYLPKPLRFLFSMLELTVRMVVHGIKARPAAVHCHDTLVLPAGLIIKIVLRSKLIYDAHELESNRNGQTALLSKIMLAIEKLAWKRVDLFISVSESIIAWYEDNLGSKSHLLILNSPEIGKINNSFNGPARGKYFHDLYGISPNKKIFIYIGMLCEGRGINLCLDAFSSRTIDAHVVFMGYGPLANKIKGFASNNQNIHIHEPVPHDQVVYIAQNADFGLCFVENVSLSDYYSLPNKLFEYAFSGIPVLASDFPEMRKVISEYNLGLCGSLNLEGIKSLILEATSSSVSFGSNDLYELSWEKQAARLINAYMDIIKLPASA